MDDRNSRRMQQEDVYSTVVKAGKRTYFFDVKTTKSDEKYLTITESKRRYSDDDEKFFYEKHKIFLYREDFENFIQGLRNVIDFIEKEDGPIESRDQSQHEGDSDDSED
ncbi:MAG TPA: DNA-binding protein [Bacteroidales bacterium]|nr:DNA-binding protein [Bacteroidales bacterium]